MSLKSPRRWSFPHQLGPNVHSWLGLGLGLGLRLALGLGLGLVLGLGLGAGVGLGRGVGLGQVLGSRLGSRIVLGCKANKIFLRAPLVPMERGGVVGVLRPVGGVFAHIAHNASYYGVYPGNSPENLPPLEACMSNSKVRHSNVSCSQNYPMSKTMQCRQ